MSRAADVRPSASSAPPARSARVMRADPARARLPGRRDPLLRLRALGRHARCAWGGREVVVEDAATADPAGLDIALFSAGGATLARARARGSPPPAPSSSTTPRPGGWTPTCRWWSARSTRDALDDSPQGHHRQPELHDDGRDAGAQAAARRGRSGAAGGQHLPGRLRQRARRRRGARRADRGRRRPRRRAHPRRRRRSSCRRRRSTSGRSRSTCCRSPARSSTTARDETDEEQKLRNESRKILDIPDLRGVRAPACGCRSSPATRCRSTPSSPRPLPAKRAARAARRRARRRADRRADAAAGRRPGPELTSAGSGRTRASTGERGLALFVSNDNLRKGAALNTVQIAELVAATL